MQLAVSQTLSSIVRVGESYRGHPQRWEYQVTVASVDGKHAVILGLRGDGDFDRKHFNAILRKIAQDGFKTAEYERIIKGTEKSRIIHISAVRMAALLFPASTLPALAES